MSTLPIQIGIATPPRGAGTQAANNFVGQSISASFAWGTSPGTATIVYIAPTTDWVVATGALCELQIGAHYFAGICKSDIQNQGTSEGLTRTLQFADLREFLTWDDVYCAFNKLDPVLINGVRVKRYKHMFPADFNAWTWTYTNTPLPAWQMIAAILSYLSPGLPGGVTGGTIGSPWAWDLTGQGLFPEGLFNPPIYEFDCLNGKPLAAVLGEFCEKSGNVVGLISTPAKPYNLVFTRKGFGALPVFPENSDNQRTGIALSGNATNIRIIGERNRYQVQDVPMQPDWSSAWQPFLVFDLFADDIYQRGTDPVSGNRFNAMTDDPEQYIGRQLATARALNITVREYCELTGDNSFADNRKYAGRWRMDMPAALYISTILWRAFRPSVSLEFTNAFGDEIPLTSLDIADRLLCKVFQSDPTTGTTEFDITTPVDSNGYAIAKGYLVGVDLFRSISSSQFSLNFFNNASAVWQHVPFQIDDSGEGVRFIIFDDPVILSENLIVNKNGHNVINAAGTLEVPSVAATLVFEAERFSYWQGTYPNVSRDAVENVSGLNLELVEQGGIFTEVPFADGSLASAKAVEIATSLLTQQYLYEEGGQKIIWQPGTDPTLFGTPLSSMVDRVQIETSPRGGTFEVVDFTNERQRDYFEPERDLDRATQSNTLFPGQAELRVQAEDARKLASAFKQLPGARQSLSDLIGGRIGSNQPLEQTWINPTPGAGTLPVGTVIRRAPTTIGSPNTDTAAVNPASYTSADSVFIGVIVRDGEDQTRPFRVQRTGLALALVQGPVSANDPVGLSDTNSFLIKNGTPAVGVVKQPIAAGSTVLVEVELGAGGAPGTSSINYRGTWNNTTTYQQGDIVRKQSGASQGIWICVATGGIVGDANAPVWPEPGTPQWNLWTFGVQETTVCTGESQTVYLNATPPM